jgi:hypothetical protein
MRLMAVHVLERDEQGCLVDDQCEGHAERETHPGAGLRGSVDHAVDRHSGEQQNAPQVVVEVHTAGAHVAETPRVDLDQPGHEAGTAEGHGEGQPCEDDPAARRVDLTPSPRKRDAGSGVFRFVRDAHYSCLHPHVVARPSPPANRTWHARIGAHDRRRTSRAMDWLDADGYTIGRLLATRGLAALYAVAFLAALLQFRALIGERGILPAPRFLSLTSFRQSPSLFHWRYSDGLFTAVAAVGLVLSVVTMLGVTEQLPLVVCMLVWFVMWLLYLSIVNVGQVWYSFGWVSWW